MFPLVLETSIAAICCIVSYFLVFIFYPLLFLFIYFCHLPPFFIVSREEPKMKLVNCFITRLSRVPPRILIFIAVICRILCCFFLSFSYPSPPLPLLYLLPLSPNNRICRHRLDILKFTLAPLQMIINFHSEYLEMMEDKITFQRMEVTNYQNIFHEIHVWFSFSFLLHLFFISFHFFLISFSFLFSSFSFLFFSLFFYFFFFFVSFSFLFRFLFVSFSFPFHSFFVHFIY